MNLLCPVCNNEFDASQPVCPFCGYKFAGSTQQFKPVVVSDGSFAAAQQPQQASLRVVRGPQCGLEFQLNERVITLGRNPHCQVFLNDMTVSRDHATIELNENGSYVIRDNNSYNGLWVNNKDVTSAVLRSGDFLQIGAFCLVFQQA